MRRATAALAASALAVGLLVAVPAAPTYAAPADRAVPKPTGTSHLSASAFAGPGGSSTPYDSGEVAHAGAYDGAGAGTAFFNDLGTIRNARVDVSQTDKIAARSITSAGSTTGTSSPGGTAVSRNEVTVSFTPARTARWKVQVTADRTGVTCIPGRVTIGQSDHKPFADAKISCGEGGVANYTLDRVVTLKAGIRYSYSAGHELSDTTNGGFSWSIKLSEDPQSVRNSAKPVVKKAGTGKYKASVGRWTGYPTSYAYQWLRGGKSIKGATKSTYTTKSADRGKRLAVKVTAKGPGGEGSATSASVGVPR